MEFIDQETLDHDKISTSVRIELTNRLTRLMDRFEMFLDDDPRDFSPGQVANYLTTARLLGSLWQTFQRPVDKSGMVSAEKVEQLLEAARTEAAALAVQAFQDEQKAQQRLALQAAGTGVRDALDRERRRQSRATEAS